jgi:AcrR family transcriptional regulator
MNKNAERGRVTRAHLIEVATRLFAADGYEGTSIEAVLRESGVSRGSLYHHFKGKDELFEAVLEAVGNRIGLEMEAATRDAPDPVAVLRIACRAWIRLASDPVVQRTMLIDAPAVLGWQRWRELDERNLGPIRAVLVYAAEQGNVEPQHVDAFAHMVLAAANEMAMVIALSDDPGAAFDAGESALTEFLDRLLSGSPGARVPGKQADGK